MAETVNIDDATGTPPAGWQLTLTGSGRPKWTEKDDTAPSQFSVLMFCASWQMAYLARRLCRQP